MTIIIIITHLPHIKINSNLAAITSLSANTVPKGYDTEIKWQVWGLFAASKYGKISNLSCHMVGLANNREDPFLLLYKQIGCHMGSVLAWPCIS